MRDGAVRHFFPHYTPHTDGVADDMMRMSCLFGAAAIPSGDRSGQLFSSILPWLLLLAVVAVVGVVVILLVRRWLTSESSRETIGFTLQDLRNLHAAGELSDEEYERARASMIGRLQSPSPPSPPPELPSESPAQSPRPSDPPPGNAPRMPD